MIRLGPFRRAVVAIVVGALLAGGGIAPALLAVGPDRSEVVLVLDFSASILDDEASRNRFGAALERIADRVDETSRDLIAGDATVSIVQFAAKAADYQGCTDLPLLGSPATVRRFSGCLRAVGGAYRKGLDAALTRQIGIDTNYVAAMEQAALHLPADAVRPTLILFSDGRHDVAGVPVSQVAVARDRLFGSRTPLALLPVGMGLDPAKRNELEAGLIGLRIIRDMPACASGAVFEWPQVVFETPDEAGTAVGVALQNATCTFTVAPTAAPTAPAATNAVHGIRLKPLDGRIEVTWSPPATATEPIVDYRVRCAAGDADPIESTEGVSLAPQATVEGLANGTAYACEGAAVGGKSAEPTWTAAAGAATPMARPAAPAKPVVEARDGGLRISVEPDDGSGASGYRYECSPDGGATWPSQVDAASTDGTSAQIGSLTNGVTYVCRAFAENDGGRSDASPLSDAVRPCGSFLECSGIPVPVVGVVLLLLGVVIVLALVALLRGRSRGYVIAVVDVVHTANLGSGSSLGLGFVRAPHSRHVDGIVADRGPNAEIRIRMRSGGRFTVTDRTGDRGTASGEPIVIVDSTGARHELVLRAFSTHAASAVSERR